MINGGGPRSGLLDHFSQPAMLVCRADIIELNEPAHLVLGSFALPVPLTTVFPSLQPLSDLPANRVEGVDERRGETAIPHHQAEVRGDLVVQFTRYIIDETTEIVVFLPSSRSVDNANDITVYGTELWLTDRLDRLVDMLSELKRCKKLDDVYRRTVEIATQQLDIDRMAIMLIDHERNTYHGTWGVNQDGRVVCEADFEESLDAADWVRDAVTVRTHSAFRTRHRLQYWGEQIGVGWNAMVNLWRGDTVIGWIVADNFLKRRPLTPAVKELLRLLGATLSQVIAFLEAESAYIDQSRTLEQQVTAKTKELNAQYSKVLMMNRQLAERERLASLGETVAGVTHELNNPVGVAVTLATSLSDAAAQVRSEIENDALTKRRLTEFVDDVAESGNLLTENLEEARRLIAAFKRIAVDQSTDSRVRVTVRDLIDGIILSHKHSWKRREITFDVAIAEDLIVTTYPGLLTQVITNLLTNSLIHGFPDHGGGTIMIAVTESDGMMHLVYSDDGVGMAADVRAQAFDPFFTTRRDAGGSGIGLSLVKDIVETQLAGTVTLTSEPDAGVRFNIDVPLAVDEATA